MRTALLILHLFVQCVKCCLLAAVKTHRLNMDNCDRDNVCTVFLVEVIKVRSVLEVVCVNLTVFNNVVRLNVIRKFFDVKRNALCGKDFLCYVKDFLMRSGGGRNSDRCALERIVIYR